MARTRQLHPDFFTDEKVVQVSFGARLCFQGLWCEADREGRLEDRPLTLKMRLFPADNVDIEALLQELVSAGLMRRYQVGDRRYLLVVNFKRRQHVHPKEVESKLPAPVIDGPELEQTDSSPGKQVMHDPKAAANASCMTEMPLEAAASPEIPRQAGEFQNVPVGYSGPSDIQAFGCSGSSVVVPAKPATTNDTELSGGGFFAWAQNARAEALGVVREKPPTRGLGTWYSHAMLETGGSDERLRAGWLVFLQDKFWLDKKPKCPWAGWVSKWEAFIPAQVPELPKPEPCSLCAEPGTGTLWGLPVCEEHKAQWWSQPAGAFANAKEWLDQQIKNREVAA